VAPPADAFRLVAASRKASAHDKGRRSRSMSSVQREPSAITSDLARLMVAGTQAFPPQRCVHFCARQTISKA